MMKEFVGIIKDLVPVISALLGAFVGGYFTRKTQRDLFDKELSREQEKERRMDDRETLILYNKLLKVDGENTVISHIGGGIAEFELDVYEEKVRPILFEQYHLLHSDIAKNVSNIDELSQMCKFNEDITDDENGLFLRYYNLIIRNARKHIYDFRISRGEVVEGTKN